MDTTGIRFVDELPELTEKRVFIRCDFNVPLTDEGEIADDARIRAAIPTIRAVLDAGAKVVLASHLGRPKGKVDDALSMVPVGARLHELLEKEVIVPEDIMDDHVDDLMRDLVPDRQILLLENLRFHPGEKRNDEEFAARLARLADVYVNDAFGTAHRAHASVYGMVEHFDQRTKFKVGGFLMRRELQQLGQLVGKPERPFVAIMGGAKVSDKLGVLSSLYRRVDTIIIGGAMAYTFLRAQGVEVGDSRVEEDLVESAREILTKAKQRHVDVLLPRDHVVADRFESDDAEIIDGEAIPKRTHGARHRPEDPRAICRGDRGSRDDFLERADGCLRARRVRKGDIRRGQSCGRLFCTICRGRGRFGERSARCRAVRCHHPCLHRGRGLTGVRRGSRPPRCGSASCQPPFDLG